MSIATASRTQGGRFMNHIKKVARRFIRDLHGNVNISDITHYIETKLYWRVIYYNTQKGDEFLRDLDPKMSNFAEKENGFCYKTVYGKYIFLDYERSDEQKLMALLHEVGHILLGHLDSGKLQNKTQNEIDANEFVKTVLCPTKADQFFGSSKKQICVSLIVIVVLVFVAAFNAIPDDPAQSAPYSGNENEIVYITPSGDKYHTANCRYAEDAIPISIERAKEHYAPCSYCNPDK